jgi:hypothetical protein
MKSRSSWRRLPLRRLPPPGGAELSRPPDRSAGARRVVWALLAAAAAACFAPLASADDAPAWLRAQLAAPIPEHDDKTDAVAMWSSTELTVLASGRVRRLERVVYRILRAQGESYGTLSVPFDSQSKITSLHAWSIPPDGKPFEAKERDAVVTAIPDVEDAYLMTDLLVRHQHVPGARVGSLVGYEWEQELRPYLVVDAWNVQHDIPVREAHFTLRLPPGWGYRASWVNAGELAPVAGAPGEWTWTATAIDAVKVEQDMPPWRGIARRMIVSWFPADSPDKGMASWSDVGNWFLALVRDRRVATPEIQHGGAALVAGAATPLAKMRALAAFMQTEVRYVAIQLGIGGFQPHAAGEVFSKRYGDCKDKATLLATLLKEQGIDSYLVVINTTRGAFDARTPPNIGFNHVILAVRLPDGVDDPSLQAVLRHPRYGRLLFFDPTDTRTPFGSLRGELQANYGLVAAPEGSELVALPQLPVASSGVQRTAHMTLDAEGTLLGTVEELRIGDAAMKQRYQLAAATSDAERNKPVEAQAAAAFATYRLDKVEAANVPDLARPLEWRFGVEARGYAKRSGGLLLVRPRVLGSMSRGLLETDEPRHNGIEFEGPERDSDEFDIGLPMGFEADELPAGLDLEYPFASYHSTYSVKNHVLHYSRRLEIRQLSVPVARAADLKAFYRAIYNDERSTAVLARSAN